MKYNVFKYLNMSPQEKVDFFLETRSSISHVASYWINFDNVQKNIQLYDEPDLYTLDYLIGKNEEEIKQFFRTRPHLLLMVPKLLGIRDDKLEKQKTFLKVQEIDGEIFLNFKEIDLENLEKYIEFLYDSGLFWVFKKGVRKSIHDYAVGLEAGMDSNGRKNRSGKAGEAFLEEVLENIAKERNWLYYGQTTGDDARKLYGVDLGEEFQNRKFDGSLYNSERSKLYLFEVNNFNSTGSKMKASATEFKDLHSRFSRTNHEFIYITDGRGWDSDKSHLKEAMEYIGKVFNYNMVKSGYLDTYLN
ncbi:DpnII family type II restriction endonuclease [Listeria sp. ILCC792]|uniref:DpnII family type II restriction endonuclease n=1 Tax=Listeria sp. ILCC792 TaxID=1918331 RepID=UPI000B595DCA|nr:DpnII family type II restriction endonuclease [Listeria sp. ILCC792]